MSPSAVRSITFYTSRQNTTAFTPSMRITTAPARPCGRSQYCKLGKRQWSMTGDDLQPYDGITSTPVIDPATNTMYVVSKQTKAGSQRSFSPERAERHYRRAEVRWTGDHQCLGSRNQFGLCQRSADAGYIVPATRRAAVGEWQCVHRLRRLSQRMAAGIQRFHSAQVGVFNASPKLNGEGNYASAGGIWMGGAGPVADSAGNVYVTTGNGPWDGQTAWGDSVLKFRPTPPPDPMGPCSPSTISLPSITSLWIAMTPIWLAGGLLMIPGTEPFNYWTGGKTSKLFLVNAANLGHEQANDAGADATSPVRWLLQANASANIVSNTK